MHQPPPRPRPHPLHHRRPPPQLLGVGKSDKAEACLSPKSKKRRPNRPVFDSNSRLTPSVQNKKRSGVEQLPGLVRVVPVGDNPHCKRSNRKRHVLLSGDKNSIISSLVPRAARPLSSDPLLGACRPPPVPSLSSKFKSKKSAKLSFANSSRLRASRPRLRLVLAVWVGMRGACLPTRRHCSKFSRKSCEKNSKRARSLRPPRQEKGFGPSMMVLLHSSAHCHGDLPC